MLRLQTMTLTLGRVILGLYFLVPGVMKFVAWNMHVELMHHHGMPLVPYLLVSAAIVEIVLGLFLLANYKIFYSAVVLAGLVLAINFNLHDFWNFTGTERAHELQNFIKNTGVMGGLFVLASYRQIKE